MNDIPMFDITIREDDALQEELQEARDRIAGLESELEAARAERTDLESSLNTAVGEETRYRDLYTHYRDNAQTLADEARAAAARDAWRSIAWAVDKYSLLGLAKQQIVKLTDEIRDHARACELDCKPMQQAAAELSAKSYSEMQNRHADGSPFAEIQWLRAYIQRAGRALHDKYGDPNPPINERCHCVGCDLVVGTDLRDEPLDLPQMGKRGDLEQRLIAAENDRDHYRGAFESEKVYRNDAQETIERLAADEKTANRRALHTVHQILQNDFNLSERVTGKHQAKGAQAVLDYIAEAVEKYPKKAKA